MKKTLIGIIALLLAGVFALALSKNTRAMDFNSKIYDFNSGYFKIITTGPMNSGVEEVYIDKGGQLEARYSETTVSAPFGIKSTQKQITYRDGNFLYAFDPKTNTATKRDLKKDSEELLKGAKQKDMHSYSAEMIKRMGGKKVGKEKLLNGTIEADVYAFEDFGSKVWYYKKFPVKNYTNMAGMEVVSEVSEMTINKPVAADKIKLPKGVKIVDAQSVDEMFGQMNAYKNTPEYQEHLKAKKSHQIPEGDDARMNDELNAAAPQIQEALKSLTDLFGNQ